MRKLLTSAALLLSLSGLGPSGSAWADGGFRGEPVPRFERRHRALRPHHARHLLPPDVPYRDATLRRRGRYAQPSFPIEGYLPRPTEAPMTNVPPPR